MDKGRAVGVVCPSFSEALTQSLTTSSFTNSGWVDRMSGQWGGLVTERQIPEGHDQWHKVQLEASHWWSPQGSILGPVLCNLFLNNQGEGTDASSARSLVTQTWDMVPVSQGGNNPLSQALCHPSSSSSPARCASLRRATSWLRP